MTELFTPGCKVWINGLLGSGKTIAAKVIAQQVRATLEAANRPAGVVEVNEDNFHGELVEATEKADIVIFDLFGRVDAPLAPALAGLLASDKTVLVTQTDVVTR